MKPYFETKNGRYFLADNKDVLAKIEDESIDMVITDPPFFEKERYSTGTYRAYVEILPELEKVMKKNSWLLVYFPSSRLDAILKDTTEYFSYADRFIVQFYSTMVKGAFGDKRTLELLVFRKGKPKLNERFYTDVLPGVDDPMIITNHPKSQLWKPTLVTSLIIKKFLGDDREKAILDPFAGMGSILIVPERLGFKWIGIDFNKEFADVAKLILRDGVEPKVAIMESKKQKQQG